MQKRKITLLEVEKLCPHNSTCVFECVHMLACMFMCVVCISVYEFRCVCLYTHNWNLEICVFKFYPFANIFSQIQILVVFVYDQKRLKLFSLNNIYDHM